MSATLSNARLTFSLALFVPSSMLRFSLCCALILAGQTDFGFADQPNESKEHQAGFASSETVGDWTAADSGSTAGENGMPARLSGWVAELSSDSYQSRSQAYQRLLGLATADVNSLDHVRRAIKSVKDRDEDLEGQIARRRLLQQLNDFSNTRLLESFLHDEQFDPDRMTGWSVFRRCAGSDWTAKLLFTRTLRQAPRFGLQLERYDLGQGTPKFSADQIQMIRRDDSLSWIMLLASASVSELPETTTISINATLRCFGTGPIAGRELEHRVTQRLVGHYLEQSSADLRDKIYIAARYRCETLTKRWCRLVLDDPQQTPSRIVTALLAASTVGMPRSEMDRWLQTYRLDHRVSHVWRTIEVPPIQHRTQVRDVALAVWLHRQSVDPRSKGFHALIADPVLVFRPYSLGFPSSEDRAESHLIWQ